MRPRWRSSLLALIAPCCLWAQPPYRELSGSGFAGPGREIEPPDSLASVRVGLIGPGDTPQGRQLRQGAMLAAAQANAGGGYRGIPFEIIARADDGPWGVAAQQVVELSYGDEVWAIIGSVDGKRAHAAELVAAKAWVPVVITAAADRTIDYANVPWVFRCLPDDRVQAEALLGAVEAGGWSRVVVVSEANRDTRAAIERLREAAGDRRMVLHRLLEYRPRDLGAIVSQIRDAKADVLLVWGHAASAMALIEAARGAGVSVPVLAPSQLAVPEVGARADRLRPLIVAAPFDYTDADVERMDFERRFIDAAGEQPTYVAAFAYDSMRLVLAAIDSAGLNRARIRDRLAQTSFDGVTGKISFNGVGGNRDSLPVLLTVEDGVWQRWLP